MLYCSVLSLLVGIFLNKFSERLKYIKNIKVHYDEIFIFSDNEGGNLEAHILSIGYRLLGTQSLYYVNTQ